MSFMNPQPWWPAGERHTTLAASLLSATLLLLRLLPRGSFAGKINLVNTGRRHSRARVIGWLLVLLATGWFAPAYAATGTCGGATGQGVNGPVDYPSYCWIDFTNYNAAQATGAGEPFTITLPGGSTLSFTLTVSGGGLNAITVPTWTGAAFGQSAFTGVPGKPSLYQTTNGATTNVTLSNIVLTVGSGTVPYALVAADAESTNNGESLSFTTNGNAWTQLAAMAYTGSALYPTLGGVGTATVTETGVAGNVGAYAFATTGSPTTISSVVVGGGLQGIAFAVKFHAVDFAITSSHTGNFDLGGTGSYTLTATSNGPDQYTPTDTVTVTDTLPTGMTYVSASGSGWTCGAVGQVVTCTANNVTVNSGSSLPAITLNVSVGYTNAATLTNTATVASNPNLDYNTANNTATDVTTLVDPDLSTSTKTVVNTGGGDAVVGSTLQYTITLTESAGAKATSASVTDDMPVSVSGFTVTSFPAGSTNSSTGTGTGANNTGHINITNITVPAIGSVTVVFTVQVATGTANCTNIDNTATVANPYGSGATPSAPTVVVAQSSCAATGNKILYLYNTQALNRTPQPTSGTSLSIPSTGTTFLDWTLTPVLAKQLKLSTGNVTFTLTTQRTGNNSNRTATAELRTGSGTSIGTSGTVTFNNAGAILSHVFTFNLAAVVTVAAGDTLVVRIHNTTAANNRPFSVYQNSAGVGASTLSIGTTTVINVDSVTAYNAAYPAVTTQTVFIPNTTVYVCAVISDPFGSYDIDPATGGTVPQITLTDPNGAVQVNAVSMVKEGATDCSGAANAADETFEYSYAIPNNAKTGFWTPTVTGYEGTEGTVFHTANGSFDLDVPSLLFMKAVTVSSDGTTNAIKHAIPGAMVLYTLTMQNTGRGPADSGSLSIADAVPTNTAFDLTGATPFTFTDGSTSSGLSAPVMTFSNNGGTSYVYSPSCTRPCTDPAITNFKITFTGSMNGKTGATAPSFIISYTAVIQ